MIAGRIPSGGSICVLKNWSRKIKASRGHLEHYVTWFWVRAEEEGLPLYRVTQHRVM